MKKETPKPGKAKAPARRNDRDRPYDGQPHTDFGIRGQAEIEGLTMRDMVDCYVMGYLYATGRGDIVASGKWDASMVYDPPPIGFSSVDPIAVAQNMMCEVEKMMGIYPNVKQLRQSAPKRGTR